MRAWLEGLEPRERLLLAIGTAALVLFLLFVLVLLPLRVGYNKLQTSVVEQRDTMQWMQQSARQVKQLQAGRGTATRNLGGRSLLAVTDSTARAGGLGTALKRIEPEGGSGVRVWLDGASFDDLVKWLGTLSNSHGVDVSTATMERSEAAGRVNARLTLQAGG
jgi:general secretion pathway protein M